LGHRSRGVPPPGNDVTNRHSGSCITATNQPWCRGLTVPHAPLYVHFVLLCRCLMYSVLLLLFHCSLSMPNVFCAAVVVSLFIIRHRSFSTIVHHPPSFIIHLYASSALCCYCFFSALQVQSGLECGVAAENFTSWQEGDAISCYMLVTKSQRLEDAKAATAVDLAALSAS